MLLSQFVGMMQLGRIRAKLTGHQQRVFQRGMRFLKIDLCSEILS